jgi:NAD-dependent DNA ligase
MKLQETEEFVNLQKELLRHKHLYYVKNAPEISDYEFDMLEKKSFNLAEKLGFRADKWEDAADNEAHHIHWMVGYEEGSIYATSINQ